MPGRCRLVDHQRSVKALADRGRLTAGAVDNARRFTHEHATAVTPQRSLPERDAVKVAWRYLPAEAGVGGHPFHTTESQLPDGSQRVL